MNNHCRCTASTFLAGLIAGALVGAGMALLYAPQTGAETRKKLKRKTEEMRKKAIIIKKEALTEIAKASDTAREKVADMKSRAKKAAAEFSKES